MPQFEFVTPSPVSPSPCQGEGEFIIKEGLTPLLNTPIGQALLRELTFWGEAAPLLSSSLCQLL